MNSEKFTTYTPESPLRHPLTMAWSMLHDLRSAHALASRLAIRDISAQYRQTMLGIAWAFLLPIANTLTWLFLSGTGIVEMGPTSLPYPIFVFSGTMLWAIFIDALNAPLQQTIASKPLLAKINFPRESLVISGIYQTIFNALIKLLLLFVVLWFAGVAPTAYLLMLPVGIASLIAAGTVLGVLVTPIGLLYGDIGKSLPLMSQFLMFLSPVVFPSPTSGWAQRLFELNPLTPLIVNARNWATGVPANDISHFVSVNLAIFSLLLLVWIVYRLAMPILIERMSA